MRVATLPLLLLVALPLAVASCNDRRPLRIVLVSLDTLRADGLDRGRGAPHPMPRTRAFSEGGLVFERHYSATSTTQPTHATVFTGRHPWQHGLSRNGQVLAAELETLAERLGEQGYYTGAVVSSYPLHPTFGFDQGFDRYVFDFTHGGMERWSGQSVVEPHFYAMADGVTDHALALLDAAPRDDQFFFFHYFDAHEPYGDARPGEGVFALDLFERIRRGERVHRVVADARALYDDDLRFLDRELARLFERLLRDEAGFDTHVLVFADHGESLGEGGAFGHGKSLAREQIRVPLILRSPRIEPGRSAVPVGSVDVAGTVLALAGLGAPGQTRDLTKPLERQPVYGMRRTFVTPYQEPLTNGEVREVTGLRFFAVRGETVWRGDQTQALPQPPRPSVAERPIRALFATFEQELLGLAPAEVLDPAVQEALEALGYTR